MLPRLSATLALVAVALLVAAALPWPGWTGRATADPAYGRALFSAKGCASCHYHATIAGSGTFSGGTGGPPSFTTAYPGDPVYLAAWLRNPQAIKPTTAMPNLGLQEDEIAALIAFLGSEVPAPR